MNEVYITRTGAFLPGAPVGNDEIEAVLGMIAGKPSKARRIILRNNGIRSRHYAIDRQSGEPAMSNAQITRNAIHSMDINGAIDVLVTGTSTPDQLLPNHAVMVHGLLGWPSLEVVSTAGICLAGITAFKHAYLAIKAGEAVRAVATGSERVSPQLLARHFEAESEHKVDQLAERPEIAFEKDFLRWMLSDGAGAVLLENAPRGALSLRVHWVELFSYAHQQPACMFAGAEQDENGQLTGWADYPLAQCVAQSTLAIKQNVRQLNDNIVNLALAEPLQALMAKRGLNSAAIDWFLPHISSMYFAAPVEAKLAEIGLPIAREKWFTNLTSKGNTGSASAYIMLDELFRSGRILPGQKILMFIPESGRFSSGFVYLEAVSAD